METHDHLQKILDDASRLLSGISEVSLHSTLQSYSILRPSLMQEHTGSHGEPLRSLITSLRHPGPKSRALEAPSSDEDSNDEGYPSVREVAESILDSQDILLTVLFK